MSSRWLSMEARITAMLKTIPYRMAKRRCGVAIFRTKKFGLKLRKISNVHAVTWGFSLMLATQPKDTWKLSLNDRQSLRRQICVVKIALITSRHMQMSLRKSCSFMPNWTQVSNMCKAWMKFWPHFIIVFMTLSSRRSLWMKPTCSFVSTLSFQRWETHS